MVLIIYQGVPGVLKGTLVDANKSLPGRTSCGRQSYLAAVETSGLFLLCPGQGNTWSGVNLTLQLDPNPFSRW